MQVVDMDFVLHGSKTKIIRGAIRHTAADSAASHPDSKPPRVVISSIRILRRRCSSEFASPKDEGVIEHSSLFQVV